MLPVFIKIGSQREPTILPEGEKEHIVFEFIEDETLRQQAIEAHNLTIAQVNEGTKKLLDEATTALKTKNDELLNEKKAVLEKMKEFEAIGDPKAAIEAMKFLKENHDAQLIKDGKVEEVIEKRVSTLKADFATRESELSRQTKEFETLASGYKRQFETKIIEDELRAAALKEGVTVAAVSDVLLRGTMLFTLGEDGTLEARDKSGVLIKNKDGIVLTPTNWIAGLKETAPHYWPSSTGADFQGGSGGGGSDITDKLAALAAKGDMAGYRKLRDKMEGKK